MLHIFLADGFEEIEALATVDILRRCGIDVQMVSTTGKRLITGAHGIPVMSDALLRRSEYADCDGIILPGGMPGAKNLLQSEALRKALLSHAAERKLIAAICAAPIVLGLNGLLKGRRATCYPGFEEDLREAECTGRPVEEDGNIITAYGPAAARDFAAAIARRFVPDETVDRVLHDMMY